MILSWDFYEIRSTGVPLHGIKLRGRIRKFTIENEVTCLMENASDEENTDTLGFYLKLLRQLEVGSESEERHN